MKRKSQLQLQTLLKFYAEDKYPSPRAMEDLAVVSNLTFKQVRGWFIEKRRSDKSKNELIEPPRLTKKLSVFKGRKGAAVASDARKMLKQWELSASNEDESNNPSSSKYKSAPSEFQGRIGKRKKLGLIQDLLTSDYILGKIFRKDGPPLGLEFDSLPTRAFHGCEDSRNSHPACQENQRANKRGKVSMCAAFDGQNCKESAPVKKHGMGKGLMTVWRVTNPDGGDFPTGIHCGGSQITVTPPISPPVSRKQPCQKKNRRQPVSSLVKQRMLQKELQEKRKPSARRREVESKRDEIQKQSFREKCELALERLMNQECLNQFAMLVDDEELELRELRAGPNPLTCTEHCAANRLYGCSLCKDLLAKFPPNSVKMKQPFAMQPWDSSLEAVKKLFKVFHFLYTYSVTVDICPFTLDELAQAFHDKDSFLLGKIHVALLKLLLSDVETEISSGLLPHLSISCKFLALIHSVEDQENVVEFWKNSLNPLTWTEILCQVLIAAGFGSKQGGFRKEVLSKEMSLMVKCGLHPGTLKGELYQLLSVQGNNGSKVSDLAKSSQIMELNLAGTSDELELLICSTLSSDITLFEKISSSTFRLRINTLAKESSDFQSDTEDSGIVHEDFHDNGAFSSSDSDCDSENSSPRNLKLIDYRKRKTRMLTFENEIDESHPGEVWLLGLMEGEYSDLSIEEKLNGLVALIDLVSAGSSIRLEDLARPTVESVPNIHHGSGAKIKRSSSTKDNVPRPSWVHAGQINDTKEAYTSSKFFPVDSSVLFSKFDGKDKLSGKEKEPEGMGPGINLHPMQSIFLGSDRRYNRYWLFLGPCNSYDPGHKRVYFESSEDGHWEVIDTEEALRALLSVLDDRGKREALLIESLEKREAFLCQEMSSRMVNDSGVQCFKQSDQSELEIVREDSSSPVSDVDNNLTLTDIANDSLPPMGAIVLETGKKGKEENQKWNRLQQFDTWIWNYFYCDLNAVKRSKRSYLESLRRCETCHDLYWRDEKHCKICHTTFELDFDLEERYAIHSATCRQKEDNVMFPKHKVLSSKLQSLKAAVYAIETVMPEDALVGAWTKSAHRLWIRRLRRTSSLAELLQVVADFVAAINEDWLFQCNLAQGSSTYMEEIITCFPTMPQTSSAIALWACFSAGNYTSQQYNQVLAEENR
ncbi:HOMEOBOX-DDT DOMAIN PROTEIN RLT2 [Salix koriyanagi]|uniref:HOMEOBOX-DDT DOMAIN PROTEIN RLT2 n=1 Tax=Salix koriyanagi TaxID=2511006 RepID=A0A9Q0U5L0_9ROSI|nr:HOMEOBOX-DDT DOMAIN PROTEIN RLT2 [Salix koriyanagi]KAJ6723906.1 HOMEOBOX-DDT DOMAIN PROTEIN RLT2 [Salix koriyanagi]KAJ6723907.1 HOMEOBOX-DDT DOMAIN PROTEIN RLT2 [Salix koriyanagi]